jgi:uncharacterized protein (TIRG00374 family)
MNSGPERGRSERLKASAFRQALGLLVAAACLVWVFHDVDWGALAAPMGAICWAWVVAAAGCEVFSYLCEGLRWQYLLLPVGRIRVVRAAQAIYIGLLANQVLPMRLGELVRAYVVGRWMNQPVPVVLPSALLGRLLDGMVMAIASGLVAIVVVVPPEVAKAAGVFGVLMLVLIALFAWFLIRDPRSIAEWGRAKAGSNMTGRVRGWAGTIAAGLFEIRSPPLLVRATLATLSFLLLQATAFWLATTAYGLTLTFVDSAVVFLIVHLGTAIPSAPASVGSFQFFTVLGLALFGVDKTMAAGFSVFVFAVLTLPLFVAGVISLSRSGMTLTAVRAELQGLGTGRRGV